MEKIWFAQTEKKNEKPVDGNGEGYGLEEEEDLSTEQ